MNVADFLINYTNVGDIISLAVCFIFWLLLNSTYTIKGNKLELFKLGDIGLVVATICRILFHILINHLTHDNVIWAYLFYDFAYCGILAVFYIFGSYMRVVVNLSQKRTVLVQTVMGVGFAFFSFMIVLSPVTHFGMYIDDALLVHQKSLWFTPFSLGYLFYSAIVLYLMIRYRRRLITKMFNCLFAVATLSFVMMGLQLIWNQTSFTTITFVFPIIAILFLFHYNAFDVDTGMLDDKAFKAYIEEKKDTHFTLVYLHFVDLDRSRVGEMSEDLYHFNEGFFRDCFTFRFDYDCYAVIFDRNKNPDYENVIKVMLEAFYKLYMKYLNDYRVIIMDSSQKLKDGEDYRGVFTYVERLMSVNETRSVTAEDVDGYLFEQHILTQLHDIAAGGNYEDDRIRVYCQPILNNVTNTFTTAEALTRLMLPDIGMVYPDRFIALAEKSGYIHELSKIILYKTCRQIRDFELEGLRIVRVSVNFSISEFKNPNFCQDILNILQETHVTGDKIAIELTESRNEHDFENVKAAMEVLRAAGIKFYLDDYGTGYSNMERILELPIDIIKFDRSLTIMSGRDNNSRLMVGSFADIFWKTGYQILFEGVEDESDEARCQEMHADYLQGFKFSKPIPIEELRDYLDYV